MNFRLARAAFSATTLILLTGMSVSAQGYREQPDRWADLGCAEVGRRTEVDLIKVERGDDRYRAIRLNVSDNSVHIERVTITYADGPPVVLTVGADINDGEMSNVLNIKGWARVIDSIELLARKAESAGRGHAQVCFQGLEAVRDERRDDRDERASQDGRDDRDPRDHRDRDQRETWTELGCSEVRRRIDVDVIKVERGDVRYKAIRLKVSDNSVHIERLTVTYANGDPDQLVVNADIANGTAWRALDLKGWTRGIDTFELAARKTENAGNGPARVCIEGLVAVRDERDEMEPPRGRGDDGRGRHDHDQAGGNWIQLGCERAGFIADHDVINVGKASGKFRALKLSVIGNRIMMRELKVVYGNGESESLAVAHELRDGEQTPPIDLSGDRRVIERVELEYGSKPSLKGEARVCVYGLN